MGQNALLRAESMQRMERARALMTKQHLDALLLFTGPNMVYLTGGPGMLGGRSGSRPFIYLLPLESDPVLIVHDGRQFEAHALTSVSDIRTYSHLSRLPLEQVVSAINDRGLQGARVGCEMSMEMVLDLPWMEFTSLQAAFPKVEFTDASSLLWKLRMVKSDAEIEWVARACAITTDAYEKTFSLIRPGMTEQQIETMMLNHMMVLGGKSAWVLVTSGPGNYDLVSKGGGERIVEPGDMVWMDSGCTFNGYYSDFSRAGVVGGPSEQQEETQRLVHNVTQLGVDMIRPGVPVAEIAARCNEALDGLMLSVTSNISGLAGRVGHGLGMVVTEQPSLNEQDPTHLETSMIVTIEPGIATSFGTFHIEENVVVTPDGPRVLSSPHWQLWPVST